MPAFKVDVVDTLGAGDAFHGAFTLRLAETGARSKSLRFASGGRRAQMHAFRRRRRRAQAR